MGTVPLLRPARRFIAKHSVASLVSRIGICAFGHSPYDGSFEGLRLLRQDAILMSAGRQRLVYYRETPLRIPRLPSSYDLPMSGGTWNHATVIHAQIRTGITLVRVQVPIHQTMPPSIFPGLTLYKWVGSVGRVVLVVSHYWCANYCT